MPGPVNFRGINNPDSVTAVTAITVDKPADTVDGDLVLVQIEAWPGTAAITAPAGFELVQGGSTLSSGGTRKVELFWKIATTEPASWQFTFSGTVDARESAISYSGADPGQPIEALAVTATNTASTSLTFPNVETLTYDAKVLCWASTESRTIVGAFYGAVTFPGAERRDDDGILLADRFDTVEPGSYSIPTITGNTAADTYVLWTLSIREPQVTAVPFAAGGVTMGVVGRDLSAEMLDAVRRLGQPLNRQEFSLADNVAGGTLDAGVARAADLGVKILPLFGYGGAYPDQAQAAQWCADLAARYGPGGTFWDANPGYPASLHMTHLEVGNESSYAHHPGTNTDPETYANLVVAIGNAVKAANPGMGLLVQADDAGLSNNWINRMFVQVPNLGDFAAAWTLHAYGPPQNRLKKRMRDIDEKVRPHSTAPVWLTEYGFATCKRSNGTIKTLSDNFGWPTNLSYSQAAAELRNVLGYIQAEWATRQDNPLTTFVYYQNTDQFARNDPSTDREHYFGLMDWDTFGQWQPKTELFSAFLAANGALIPVTTRRMPRWVFVLADRNGNALADLDVSTGKTLTFKRNGVPELGLTLSHEDAAAQALLESLVTTGVPTCRAYRDGVLRFNGYLAPFTEQLEEQARLSLVFRGPFGRLIGDGTGRGAFNTGIIAGYGPGEAKDVAILLVDIAQGNPLAHSPPFVWPDKWVGIVFGALEVTGQQRERASDGSFNYINLGEELLHLTRVLDGFDFEIAPIEGLRTVTVQPGQGAGGPTELRDMPVVGEFNLYARQGEDRPDGVFEYGPSTVANVRNVSRQTLPPVNAARVVGAIIPPATAAIKGESKDAASIAMYGEWWQQESRPDINEQSTLDAKARALVRPFPIRVVSFSPDPALSPRPWDDFWLGDTVRFHGRRGAFAENIITRVNQIRVVIDDEGNEAHEIEDPDGGTLTAEVQTEIVPQGAENVGGSYETIPGMGALFRGLDGRIAALERTQTRAGP